jgi:group I intron endonuclease
MIFNVTGESKISQGVYCIRSTIDDRLYVGSTRYTMYRRYSAHLNLLKVNKHTCNHLQNFVNKYGVDKLVFEILEIVEDKEKVLEREQYWIDKYWDSGLLFNEVRDAKAPMLGRKHTKEELEKMKLARRGRVVSEETKVKISLANTGKRRTEETKKKISLSCIGKSHSYTRIMTENLRLKLSEANKGNTHRLGKKHTEETLVKMTGRKRTEEAKMKMSLARIGKKFPRSQRTEDLVSS